MLKFDFPVSLIVKQLLVFCCLKVDGLKTSWWRTCPCHPAPLVDDGVRGWRNLNTNTAGKMDSHCKPILHQCVFHGFPQRTKSLLFPEYLAISVDRSPPLSLYELFRGVTVLQNHTDDELHHANRGRGESNIQRHRSIRQSKIPCAKVSNNSAQENKLWLSTYQILFPSSSTNFPTLQKL